MVCFRPAEYFAGVSLSVQASDWHCSIPREDNLPLADYKRVEVAIVQACEFKNPSEVGLPAELDELFIEGVAPYVTQSQVGAIRAALRARQQLQEVA